MARHAGFGAIVSITQNLANDMLSTVAANKPGLSFNVPNISIGGASVLIAGSLKPLAPVITLHERADGLVTATLSLQGTLTLSSSPMPSQTANVVLSTGGDISLNAVVVDGKVFAVLDMTQISITQLAVTSSNPPLTQLFSNAIASPEFLASVTDNLRQLSLLATPPLMSSTISQPVSQGMPPGSNVSIFPPYPSRLSLTLSIGRMVVKPFEGTLTVAADFEGITSGDPSQIGNLLTQFSPLVTYIISKDNNGISHGAYTEAGVDPHANLVVLINSAVFANILSTQVSPAFDRGPCVGKSAIIHSVSANMGWFDAGVPWGPGYGLTIAVDASAYGTTTEDGNGYYWPASALHAPANITLYLRPTGIDPGGNENAFWTLELVNDSVGLPEWLQIALLIPVLVESVVFPVFLIVEAVVAPLVAGVLAGLVPALEEEIFKDGAAALASANTPALQTPFFSGATWTQDIWKMGFNSEGAEAHVQMYNPVRVSSLRQNLALRGLGAKTGLRMVAPAARSIRALMGS